MGFSYAVNNIVGGSNAGNTIVVFSCGAFASVVFSMSFINFVSSDVAVLVLVWFTGSVKFVSSAVTSVRFSWRCVSFKLEMLQIFWGYPGSCIVSDV